MKKILFFSIFALTMSALYSQSTNDKIWDGWETTTVLKRPDGGARVIFGTADAVKTGEKSAMVIYESNYGLSNEDHIQDVVPVKYLSAKDTVAKDTTKKVVSKKHPGKKHDPLPVVPVDSTKIDTVKTWTPLLTKEDASKYAHCTGMPDCFMQRVGYPGMESWRFIEDSCTVIYVCNWFRVLDFCSACKTLKYKDYPEYLNGHPCLEFNGDVFFDLYTGKIIEQVKESQPIVQEKFTPHWFNDLHIGIKTLLVIFVIAALFLVFLKIISETWSLK
jgi:hypothetical protein